MNQLVGNKCRRVAPWRALFTLALLSVVLGMSGVVLAKQLAVVATTTSMGVLASAVGGDQVALDVLAPPDRYVHYLQARPSIIRLLRQADLVVSVGADLEVGWLPAALASSANPRVQPGRPGYFEATADMVLMDAQKQVDRSMGDVHAAGNPHIQFDPLRMAEAAQRLAVRLAELDAAQADHYRARASQFSAQMAQWVTELHTRHPQLRPVVLFHKDAVYLMARFGIPVLGYIEPLPGIPPNARHLQTLVTALRSGPPGVVVRAPFHPASAPDRLAGELGWPVAVLALDPPLPTTADYQAFIERWLQALAVRE